MAFLNQPHYPMDICTFIGSLALGTPEEFQVEWNLRESILTARALLCSKQEECEHHIIHPLFNQRRHTRHKVDHTRHKYVVEWIPSLHIFVIEHGTTIFFTWTCIFSNTWNQLVFKNQQHVWQSLLSLRASNYHYHVIPMLNEPPIQLHIQSTCEYTS